MTAPSASTVANQPVMPNQPVAPNQLAVPIRRRDIEIGNVKADPQTSVATSRARSYLSDGRRVTWSPPRAPGVLIAVDAELADQPVPRSLGRRFGDAGPLDFWPLWTTTEVHAKLLDVPILVWLARYGLRTRVSGVRTRTLVIDGVIVSCGWCPVDTTHRPSQPARSSAWSQP